MVSTDHNIMYEIIAAQSQRSNQKTTDSQTIVPNS